MKKLSIGAQELSVFKENNYIYIDKTKIIHKLINSGRYYFLSRPRRFGKSLLVNTMKELFLGNKELFDETWIYDKWKWEVTYPVIHIDFTGLDYRSLGLEIALDKEITKIARTYNIKFETSSTYSEKFIKLIEQLGKENGVVILIDEYDKPIIDYIDKEHRETADENRQILKNLYSGLKKSDKYIKLLFITGVSKFARVSIFSELNNLEDITTSETYSQIVGYTQEEIINNYSEYVEEVKKKYKMDNATFLNAMKLWYNGYSWDAENFLYNPFSILNLFSSRTFDNYWFKSGTPTFLTKLIREKNNIDIAKYDNLFEIESAALDSYEINNIDINVLLFQTGYLTIKESIIDPKEFYTTYRLAYPNKEVRDSFYTFLISEYTGVDKTSFTEITKKLKISLENYDIDEFIINLTTLFAEIPYDIFIEKREAYYHTIIYLILRMLGIKIDVEVEINRGRLDARVKTDKYIYIMEFKMGTAEEAIKQIEEKQYYLPYITDGRKVILLGVAFDKKKKNIKEWLIKEV